jgi:hypothetical protein
MKVHLRFILLLALGAVIDPHVELRRADMEVESHEEALVEVMIVTSQNVGQLRGRLEGLLCIASAITGFFRAFFTKT